MCPPTMQAQNWLIGMRLRLIVMEKDGSDALKINCQQRKGESNGISIRFDRHHLLLRGMANQAADNFGGNLQIIVYYTNSDNKSLINICRVIVGGASLPRLFPLNAQNAEDEIALCVSDRNATFLFRNGITQR